MITAEQVRAAMREHELSQSQVARMSKVSAPVIREWLSGRREPSEVSRTRIALALDLIGPGESDDAAIGEALNADTEAEAPARSASDDVTLYDSDEAAAAAEIMAALSMHDDPDPPETSPAPAPTPKPEPAPEPEPEAPADSAAELLYRLTRLPGFHIYEDREGDFNIAIPRDSALERFAHNLEALDVMLRMDEIAAAPHAAAAQSLLEVYRRREAGA